jgi:hypothetical protein
MLAVGIGRLSLSRDVEPGEEGSVGTVHLHAVRVADNDGLRAANITRLQVKSWVDYANQVYSVAGVRFAFDPNNQDDWSAVNDTMLNNMMGTGDANWARRATGNCWATPSRT